MARMTTGDRTRPPTNAAGKSSRLDSILASNAKKTKDKPPSAGPKAPAKSSQQADVATYIPSQLLTKEKEAVPQGIQLTIFHPSRSSSRIIN